MTAVFLAVLALVTALRLALRRRQERWLRAHRERVPEPFAGTVAPAEQARACDYARARLRLARASLALEVLLLLGWTLGGGLEALQRIWGPGGLLAGTGFLLSAFALQALLTLPLAVARVFGVEERFGFNRTTPRLFLADLARQALLGVALGGPLLLGALALLRSGGPWWWLIAWAGWLAFSLLAAWIWPTWIAPLFNRFEPLDDPELARRLRALAERAGFEFAGISVMDGSRRSAHGNAYFTGFGRRKRIALYDTLLGQLGPDEVEAVLAHELGHFAKRHVLNGLALGAAVGLAGLALLGWVETRAWFYAGLGVETPTAAAALLLFFFVGPLFAFPLRPLFAGLSRRHEYEADAYAARLAGAGAMERALVALVRNNAAPLTADPMWSAFFDSHPPPDRRVAHLRTVG